MMSQSTMDRTMTAARATPASKSIALWVARIAAAGVMLAGALPKFFNYTDDGAKQLADALGLGRLEITGLGAVELVAGVLLLLAATRSIGALLATGLMAGALFSHATILGFSGTAPAEMWPLALVGLAAAGVVLLLTRRELPLIGKRL